MAVQLDAAADRLTWLGTLPRTSDGWTYTAWIRLDVDRNDFSTWLRLSAAGSTIATCSTNSDGTSGPNYFTAIASASRVTDMSTPATGVWVPVAGKRSASSGDIAALCKPNGTDPTVIVTGDLATTDVTGTPDQICLGGRDTTDANEWWSGSIAHERIWSVELTQAEIEAEWASPTPVRTSGLWDAWELADASDLTSINGRTLAVQSGGSLATVAGPNLGTSGVVAGSLPGIGGSLAGNVIAPGVVAGALPALGGGLTGQLVAPGALAGALPALGGSFAGQLVAIGALGGALPGLAGALAVQVVSPGVLAGALPGLSGVLAADLITTGVLGGTLPALGGHLTDERPVVGGAMRPVVRSGPSAIRGERTAATMGAGA